MKYLDENGNLGKDNIGKDNIGNCNVGDKNSGSYNKGNYNIGNHNIGNKNLGDNNKGNGNYGNSCVGDGNSGKSINGDFNIGNYIKGSFNSNEFLTGYINPYRLQPNYSKVYLFGLPTDKTFEEVSQMDGIKLLKQINKNYNNLLLEANSLTILKKDGVLHLKALATRKWWSELSEEDRQLIYSIDNFDMEVFKKTLLIVD